MEQIINSDKITKAAVAFDYYCLHSFHMFK